MSEIIQLKNITKTVNIGAGKKVFNAVEDVSLLGRPTTGSVIVNDKDFLSLSDKQLREERKKIGMIFQHFNLMKSRTAEANVAFPLKYSGLSKAEIEKKVHELLSLVEIDDKAKNYPGELSGGQKQRVAIARALANDPHILLCDEATSALDPTTTRSILKLLKKLNKQLGLTIVIITHQMEVIKEICDKVAVMENGRIVERGEVFDIFANPKSEVTKRFIRSTSTLTKVEELIEEDSPVVRLAKNVSEPIISAISRLYEITINIIFASVEIVQDAPIGGTVAIISGKKDVVERALGHIKAQGVGVEVLKTN